MTEKRKILFVDDDPNVLAEIESAFQNMRNAFQLFYAHNGQEALGVLSCENIEVVFSDIDMPVMDGMALFSEIKDSYPDIIRIVLSRKLDKQMTYRSLAMIHRFIEKPFSKTEINMAILEALSFKDFMNNPKLVSIINSMDKVPSMPLLYHQIMERLWSVRVSMKDIAELVSQDIGMTSQILKLVNSAFFGHSREISSINEAITYLGVNTLKTLVLVIHVFSEADNSLLEKLNLSYLWEHSIKVAEYAQAVVKDYSGNKFFIETVATAGLLHDIGKLILAINFPTEYQNILKKYDKHNTTPPQFTLTELEEKAFGTNHCEVGAYLLGIWGLPHPITNTILYHNTPAQTVNENFNALLAVHVADAFENEFRFKPNLPGKSIDTTLFDNLKLNSQIDMWRKLLKAEAK